MKKIQVKQITICVSVVFLVVIFFLAVTIGIKLKAMHTENDTYIEYTCRDFHLVALEQGDCVGYKDIVLKNRIYRDYYNLIKNISDKDFIVAERRPLELFSAGSYYVLQSPQNQIDVFNDWNVKTVRIYLCDESDERNTNRDQKAVENWVIQELVSSSEETMLKQIQEMPLNVEPETGSSYKNNNDEYKEIGSDKDMYLRILFEESEYIAWDAPIRIYQSKADQTKYNVVIHVGNMNEEFEQQGGYYVVDSSSELYDFILDAYEISLEQNKWISYMYRFLVGPK